METARHSIDPAAPDGAAARARLARAAEVLTSGGLVAFPTETVYGLGANALDEAAVARIFEAKGRPSFDPLIVHVGDAGHLGRIARDVPDAARALAERFWPGPLTLVLPRGGAVPHRVTAGGETVGVRVPAHPVARALLAASGLALAAPSANRFAHTSPTTAQHVLDDLEGRIDMVLDGGPCAVGVESTVLDVTRAVPRVLRPGAVTVAALREVLGEVELRPQAAPESAVAASDEPLRGPGLLERHYAPRSPLRLFRGDDPAAVARALARASAELHAGGRTTVALVAAEDEPYLAPDEARVVLGSLDDLTAVARGLYAALREAEARAPDAILARGFPRTGVGVALDDRLRRAAESIEDVG
ncbi:MAG: L-threonylcarbamoyladenylate synthase [Planctomycetota bacterium]